jgi:hypothetical protein
MARILGVGRKKPTKQRLSPSARTPEDLRQKHPMFQYAVNEYSQTVAAGTSNDDGRLVAARNALTDDFADIPRAPSGVTSVRSLPDDGVPSNPESGRVATGNTMTQNPFHTAPSLESQPTNSLTEASIYNSSTQPMSQQAVRSPFEAELADATYEEHYGAAYTGGPIKYIYPSGYQSMRPRSCPWKLSIVVCCLFTWLSVFIVGHCSDQVDEDKYKNAQIDDDSLAIDIRWCGSRPLYLMWVASMLITGVSAAYCSVIGYIKVRDFTVANSRSQPPGVIDAKSDYYVSIGGVSATWSQDSHSNPHHQLPAIYQSDGTPQFWGSHIYRPTQAAVAVTSR